MNDTPDSNQTPRLSDQDAAAFDALVESGFEIDRVPAELRDRAERAAALMGYLDFGAASDSALLDDTETRIRMSLRPIESPPADVEEAELSQLDHEALETLVMSRFDDGRAPGELRPRAARHARLRDLVTKSSPATESWIDQNRTDLHERVMAEITHAGPAPMPIERAQGRFRFRLTDIAALAAVLVLLVSVSFPLINSTRQSAMQAACFGNFGAVASAMSSYANDHADALPIAAPNMGSSWLRVGKGANQSNSANLYVTVRAGYAPLETLACPGNEHAADKATPDRLAAVDWLNMEEPSYSYQIVWGAAPKVWRSASDRIILTDRSPVVLKAANGETIIPEEASPNHRGAHGGPGQHALHMDGSSAWLSTPVLKNGDNIWLPRHLEVVIADARRKIGIIKGAESELPTSAEDVFVGP